MEIVSNILVVDDNKNNLELLSDILEMEGYYVRTAETGEEALKMVFQERPDLMLLDIMLPGIDGYSVCDTLKKRIDTQDIPIILVSAKSTTKDTIEGLAHGADDYIRKPYNDNELLARVKATLKMKHLYDEVHHTNRMLSNQKEQIETIINTMGEGLFSVNQNMEIVFFNPAAEEITGYNFREAIGKKCATIFNCPDADECCSLTAELAPDPKQKIVREYVLERKDGSTVPIIKSTRFLVTAEEEIMGKVEVFRDISQEKDLEQKNADFISMVIHDLKNPLTTITICDKIVLNETLGKIDEDLTRLLQNIESSANHLLNQVNELLDISKLDSGLMEFKRQRIDMNDVMEISMHTQRVISRQKKIDIEKDFAAERYPIMGDKDYLMRVMINLIGNAIKFTPSHGKIRVVARDIPHLEPGFPTSPQLEEAENILKISIVDNGTGIPEEDLPTIFEKYRRVRGTTEIEGSGLGLYIVKVIIEGHGGHIWLEDTSRQGSTFTILLPALNE
jgi:two-component system phosphate regulon sensor histidine kinase PhoR